MRNQIDVDRVTRVLLADGWHDVADEDGNTPCPEGKASSFGLGTVEFVSERRDDDDDFIERPAFAFTEPGGQRVTGPLTSVLAVAAWGEIEEGAIVRALVASVYG